MAKRGRPPKYNRPKVMQAVCARIAQGELVKDAARHVGVDPSSIREWGLLDEFSALYTRARVSQAHAMAEEAIAIADGSDDLGQLLDEMIALRGAELLDRPERHQVLAALRSERVSRDRVRTDARKWLTSKIAPKIYGDKQSLEVTGEDGGAVQIAVIGGKRVRF